MDRRLELHKELEELLGSKNVYWQPPNNVHMNYPCIVYEKRPIETIKADNQIYIKNRSWDLTYIRSYGNRDAGDELVDEILDHFTYCSHSAHFISDNLIHDAFRIYY